MQRVGVRGDPGDERPLEPRRLRAGIGVDRVVGVLGQVPGDDRPGHRSDAVMAIAADPHRRAHGVEHLVGRPLTVDEAAERGAQLRLPVADRGGPSHQHGELARRRPRPRLVALALVVHDHFVDERVTVRRQRPARGLEIEVLLEAVEIGRDTGDEVAVVHHDEAAGANPTAQHLDGRVPGAEDVPERGEQGGVVGAADRLGRARVHEAAPIAHRSGVRRVRCLRNERLVELDARDLAAQCHGDGDGHRALPDPRSTTRWPCPIPTWRSASTIASTSDPSSSKSASSSAATGSSTASISSAAATMSRSPVGVVIAAHPTAHRATPAESMRPVLLDRTRSQNSGHAATRARRVHAPRPPRKDLESELGRAAPGERTRRGPGTGAGATSSDHPPRRGGASARMPGRDPGGDRTHPAAHPTHSPKASPKRAASSE